MATAELCKKVDPKDVEACLMARENYHEPGWFLAVNEGFAHHLSRHDPCAVGIDFTRVQEASSRNYFHFYYKDDHVGQMTVDSEKIAEVLRKIPIARG